MSKKENNNNMLSFDKLREGLGIEGELPPVRDSKIIVEDNPPPKRTVEKPLAEGKTIQENGNTFIDITDQFTFYEVEPVKDVEIISVPEVTPIEAEATVQKKRVKTFNELFTDFFKSFIPLKTDSGKEIFQKIAMDFSLIIIICCLIGIIGVIVENLQNADDDNIQYSAVDRLEENEYADAWKDAYQQSSGSDFPVGMESKYAYLYTQNQDLVGWLKINNTTIDTQLVQSSDNEYYASRDFYKNSSQYGCPYLDYKNNKELLDDNTVIYGPYMSNGLSFTALDQYKTLNGYKNSPLIEYSTLYNTYSFKVFAVFIADSDSSKDNGFVYTGTNFVSDAKFLEFINDVKQRSIINTDVSVQTDDKIITLITSSNEFEGARLVVMGRMVRENESLAVDVDSATLNTSPKYPQAWYDNKSNNPFS